MSRTQRFLCEAIELAQANLEKGGRPFGAVVVKDGEVVAAGVNETVATHDPTAHAEMTALRAASRKLASPSLAGCAVYASGHPCPMCMAAMRLSGVGEVYYAIPTMTAQLSASRRRRSMPIWRSPSPSSR